MDLTVLATLTFFNKKHDSLQCKNFFFTFFQNHNDPSWDGLLLWPVCCLGNILIHLLEDNSLLPGQQYLYIKRSTEGQFNLAVKCISVLGIKDVILENNSDIGNMLKMEWSNRFKMRSDEDLGKLLQKTMSTFEDSIQRIKLEETTDSCKDCNRNRQIADSKKLPFPNRPKFKRPGKCFIVYIVYRIKKKIDRQYMLLA